MKRKVLFLMMALPLSLLAQTSNYVISGKIGHVDAPARVFIGYKIGNKAMGDSALIKDGAFELKGTISEPVKATLVLNYSGQASFNGGVEVKTVYLEPGIIKITSPDSLVHAVVSGKVNAEGKKLDAELQKTNAELYALSEEMKAIPAEKKKDKAFMKTFMESYIARQKAILSAQHQIRANFISKHPNSVVSLDALDMISRYVDNYSVINSLFETLSPFIKSTEQGQIYVKRLALSKVKEVGSTAVEFSQPDVNGKLVKLSDYRGKYVLVDFWASWCYACRLENPNVVKAYTKYHDKGFEIIGISLDDQKAKAAWFAAIKKDGLTWTQVSDLKGWKNAAAVSYGISAIPQNVLVDPNGKIVGRNLKGTALDAKLAEIFPAK